VFVYGQTGSGKTHTMEGYDYQYGPGSTGMGHSTCTAGFGPMDRSLKAPVVNENEEGNGIT
jgi:hypothetical protein